MKKSIPKFRSKEEAALFWENHEMMDYLDPDEFKVVDPKKNRRYSFSRPGKEKKQLVSLRIDSQLIKRAKSVADKKQVGYQTILRSWLEKGAPGSH